jgi:hypothetical protein
MSSINVLKAAALYCDGINSYERMALAHKYIEDEVNCLSYKKQSYDSRLNTVCDEIWEIVSRYKEAEAVRQFEEWQNREEAFARGEI